MSAPLTAVQWLVRAEEARLDAAAMNDPQAKRMMLVMAAGYERLAAHATCLELSGLPHEASTLTGTNPVLLMELDPASAHGFVTSWLDQPIFGRA
jgi:hypothetical protein